MPRALGRKLKLVYLWLMLAMVLGRPFYMEWRAVSAQTAEDGGPSHLTAAEIYGAYLIQRQTERPIRRDLGSKAQENHFRPDFAQEAYGPPNKIGRISCHRTEKAPPGLPDPYRLNAKGERVFLFRNCRYSYDFQFATADAHRADSSSSGRNRDFFGILKSELQPGAPLAEGEGAYLWALSSLADEQDLRRRFYEANFPGRRLPVSGLAYLVAGADPDYDRALARAGAGRSLPPEVYFHELDASSSCASSPWRGLGAYQPQGVRC